MMINVINGWQGALLMEKNVLIHCQLNVILIRAHRINAKNSAINLALQQHNHAQS